MPPSLFVLSIQSTDTFRLAYVQRVLTLGLIPDLTSPLAFDAVWSLAFALNRTMRKVAMGEEGGCVGLEGDLVPLENFTYHNKKMGCILKESIAETEFKGVTVSEGGGGGGGGGWILVG